ncbi:transposase [Variovorax sp. J22R115]|uniref:transposase n=1 Tax=Variovorax sp. J22R115 TaxID=3053509 RepID=UPI0025788A7E|nr:transposase [Variovorax sp. J22R115]MDM0053513.1 transposase [Variovorax sp. J22R115]
MNTIEATAVKGERRRRRRHSDEFKANLVAACARPGVSIASVALANGINANLLRRWMIEGGQGLPGPEATAELSRDQSNGAFVAVQLGAAQSSAVQDLRIELKRGATTVVVHWPSSACAASAAWLREILR